MYLSNYYLPTLKAAPAEAKIKSHILMLRAGMIRANSAGIYSWLPFGLKILQNIQQIIRKNMSEAGVLELLMPCIQDGDLWRESGRFDSYGQEMLKIKDRHGHDLLFSPTNEEMITKLVKGEIKSYKELPKIIYQIQWKFRDEIRPRFGLMRGREFLMKDAYSLDLTKEAAAQTYDKMFDLYLKTFKEMGLDAIPIMADSGEIGGDMSHEFHILAETGESVIYYDKKLENLDRNANNYFQQLKNLYAVEEGKYQAENCPISQENIRSKRGIEIGQIFNFSDKYSKQMGATIRNQAGDLVNLEMGSYGIGVSRLVAALIEVHNDERGIKWPWSVAPFKIAIINLNIKDEQACKMAEQLYQQLTEQNIETLYDDTNERAGVKFATHDLIGSPWHIIISPKKLANNLLEVKNRTSGQAIDLPFTQVINYIKKQEQC